MLLFDIRNFWSEIASKISGQKSAICRFWPQKRFIALGWKFTLEPRSVFKTPRSPITSKEKSKRLRRRRIRVEIFARCSKTLVTHEKTHHGSTMQNIIEPWCVFDTVGAEHPTPRGARIVQKTIRAPRGDHLAGHVSIFDNKIENSIRAPRGSPSKRL